MIDLCFSLWFFFFFFFFLPPPPPSSSLTFSRSCFVVKRGLMITHSVLISKSPATKQTLACMWEFIFFVSLPMMLCCCCCFYILLTIALTCSLHLQVHVTEHIFVRKKLKYLLFCVFLSSLHRHREWKQTQTMLSPQKNMFDCLHSGHFISKAANDSWIAVCIKQILAVN